MADVRILGWYGAVKSGDEKPHKRRVRIGYGKRTAWVVCEATSADKANDRVWELVAAQQADWDKSNG